MSEAKLLFSIRSYAKLGHRIARQAGIGIGSVHVENWKDGELYQRVESPIRGRDAVLVAGTDTEARTLEAFDLASALVEQGASSLAVLIPFFGYATMERAWMRGDVVTAKSRARLWSALPSPPGGVSIRILEPHTAGLPHYFGPEHRVEAIDASGLMLELLRGSGSARPVLCSPDSGRIKWVDALARETGKDCAFVLKRRGESGSVQGFGIAGRVKERNVVLCDDMVRTGGTLLEAARICREEGATSVSAAVIHGAFAPDALRDLEKSGVIDALCCTDSHPHAQSPLPAWISVHSCAGLMASVLAP